MKSSDIGGGVRFGGVSAHGSWRLPEHLLHVPLLVWALLAAALRCEQGSPGRVCQGGL